MRRLIIYDQCLSKSFLFFIFILPQRNFYSLCYNFYSRITALSGTDVKGVTHQFTVKTFTWFTVGPRLKSFIIWKTDLPSYIKWRQILLHSPFIIIINIIVIEKNVFAIWNIKCHCKFILIQFNWKKVLFGCLTDM